MQSKIILLIALAVCCVASSLAGCIHEPGATAESYICEGINNLGRLEGVPASAQRLTILNSMINSLPEGGFEKWSDSLIYLNLTRCQLSDINPGAFRSLSRLEELILDDNDIIIIRGNWLIDIPNLKRLRIWKNHVKEIEPEVFQHLQNLELLDIAYNKIDHCLTPEDLIKLRKLEILHITGNPWPLRCRPPTIFHLENHHVQLIHNWRTTHLFIVDCLAHEFGALWDDEVLKKCVESHANSSPLLAPTPAPLLAQ